MRVNIFSLVFSALLTLSTAHAAGPGACVLSYLPNADPMARAVVRTFAHAPAVKLTTEALPEGFVGCIKDRYSQIVIIAHAFELTDDGGKPLLPAKVKLGYFVHQSGSLYRESIFFDHLFQIAGKTLAEQAASGQGIALKEVRIMTCDPQGILDAYPSLGALVDRYGILLDTAPTSALLSLFSSVPVTSFSEAWLAKSVDCQSLKKWKTPENSYCEQDFWPGCDRSEVDYCVPLD